jgi:hypothetical protein
VFVSQKFPGGPGGVIGPGMAIGPVTIRMISSSTWTPRLNAAYLEATWARRPELNKYESWGFGQFFYLTLMGHVEGRLAEVIDRRLKSILEVLETAQKRAPEWNLHFSGQSFSCEPAIISARSLVDSVNRDIAENLTFEKLCNSFRTLFGRKVSALVGNETWSGIDSLRKLRNVFAHGRNLSFTYEQDEESAVSWESSQLKSPAEQLVKAGVIKDIKFTSENSAELLAAFFSEPAMLYFYRLVREFEQPVGQVLDLPGEKVVPLMVTLPDLAPIPPSPEEPRRS